MASIKPILYYAPASFYSQKVLLALDEKGVDYTKKLVKLLEFENYTPSYMKLNALGKLPLMQHGDTFIADSTAITEYIEKNFDGPKLFPGYRPVVQELITLIDSLQMFVLTFGIRLAPDLYTDSQVPPDILEYMRDRINSKKMKATLERHKAECLDDPELQAAYNTKLSRGYQFGGNPCAAVVAVIEHADGVFALLNNRLEEVSKAGNDKLWLVSEEFTAADIALAVALQRLTFVGLKQRLWAGRPLVEKYRQRLLAEKPVYVNDCVSLKVWSYRQRTQPMP